MFLSSLPLLPDGYFPKMFTLLLPFTMGSNKKFPIQLKTMILSLFPGLQSGFLWFATCQRKFLKKKKTVYTKQFISWRAIAHYQYLTWSSLTRVSRGDKAPYPRQTLRHCQSLGWLGCLNGVRHPRQNHIKIAMQWLTLKPEAWGRHLSTAGASNAKLLWPGTGGMRSSFWGSS